MPKLTDMTGRIYGRLTVISRAETVRKQTRWRCRCSCGTETVVHAGNLRSGGATSCGCFMREHAATRATKHGACDTRTYRIWKAMRTRATNPRVKTAKHYVLRGVACCDRWRVYANFVADMGEAPHRASLDRIDNAGNYEPGNCRWATPTEQANNKRNNTPYTFDGETHNASEWARSVGVHMHVTNFIRVVKRGWTLAMVRHYASLNSTDRLRYSRAHRNFKGV